MALAQWRCIVFAGKLHFVTLGETTLPLSEKADNHFEFIPLWGFLVFFLYSMRRVSCRHCGVVVEEVPWGDGKYQSTKAHMLYQARWASKLSWKETAESFHTSWDRVRDAVEYVVTWAWTIASWIRSAPSAYAGLSD
jgi:hypothetical protein